MPPETEDFILEVCELKHSNIDDNIKEINADIEKIKDEDNERHEEIKQMIINLAIEVRDSNTNLKNKIVLASKTMGDKIDDLNDFDKSLRGNGNPGIWESIRNTRRNVKIIMWTIFIIIILILGGDFEGVSMKKIKKMFTNDNKKIEKVEPIIKIIQIPKELSEIGAP